MQNNKRNKFISRSYKLDVSLVSVLKTMRGENGIVQGKMLEVLVERHIKRRLMRRTIHLQQNLNQKAPNLVWASDFTCIRVNDQKYYLCIVMDLFLGKIISWDISSDPDVNLIISVFKKAYQKRNEPSGLRFHSDRGPYYTAPAFRQMLASLNVVQSFSKEGCPFDNACCESFFKRLITEEVNCKEYHSVNKLRLSIFEYIEDYYNAKRPDASWGMFNPNEKEQLYLEQY